MSKCKLLLQTLCCVFMILVIENAAFAMDSTNFNPVPIEVKAKSTSGVPVGTIVAWPVAANPEDMDKWLECNGQPVNPTIYPELFALIGGNTPDFRNNFLNGASGNVGTASLYRLGIWRPDAVSYWLCGNHGPQHAVLKSWDAVSMTEMIPSPTLRIQHTTEALLLQNNTSFSRKQSDIWSGLCRNIAKPAVSRYSHTARLPPSSSRRHGAYHQKGVCRMKRRILVLVLLILLALLLRGDTRL